MGVLLFCHLAVLRRLLIFPDKFEIRLPNFETVKTFLSLIQ